MRVWQSALTTRLAERMPDKPDEPKWRSNSERQNCWASQSISEAWHP
ncbi:MAG: hypothetical protein ACUVRR_13045 [Candidatus Fervidibacter sp.]